MRRAVQHKVLAMDSAYIDPIGCDSTISYKVIKGRRLYGNLQLADCNRRIEWYFHNDRTALTKIDKAIIMLASFRDEFAKAQKAPKKRTKTKIL